MKKELGKSIHVMECALLVNKELNVILIDLPWENSIDASVTFGTHTLCVYVCGCGCVCVIYITNLNIQSCKLFYFLS